MVYIFWKTDRMEKMKAEGETSQTALHTKGEDDADQTRFEATDGGTPDDCKPGEMLGTAGAPTGFDDFQSKDARWDVPITQ